MARRTLLPLPALLLAENSDALAHRTRDGRGMSAEPIYVRSPGGWTAPKGRVAGWNWFPPGGASPRLDEAPRLARWLFHRPVIQRVPHTWLWRRGYWTVEAVPGSQPSSGDIVDRESPLRRETK
jgi:hypothetical protein